MSLNWELAKIKDWKNVCQTTVQHDDVNRGVKQGDTILNTTTEGLIWMAMLVDLGSITAENVEEWVYRVEVCRILGLSPMTTFKDGHGQSWYPTVADIRAHIGLATNVSNTSRVAFLKKARVHIDVKARENAKYALREEKPEVVVA